MTLVAGDDVAGTHAIHKSRSISATLLGLAHHRDLDDKVRRKLNHGGEAKSPKVIGQSDGWHRDTRVDGFQSYTHRQMTHEFMRENDGLY